MMTGNTLHHPLPSTTPLAVD